MIRGVQQIRGDGDQGSANHSAPMSIQAFDICVGRVQSSMASAKEITIATPAKMPNIDRR